MALAVFPAAGHAQTVTAPPIVGTSGSTQRTPPLVDLQIQQSIDQRQAFEQLQRLQRQQDRDAVRYRPERLEVPVMRPSCSSSVHGSSLSSGCR
ncbi:hypothetical protein EJC49_25360 [Aquibium carbonis]|uniref:Uncharacterized protein n=1 Tax=Aquibium carbonis TaxID=2495581 RepID=A0A429YBE4_9HYPH|nr:hypothetical protein [Aquibium carbonis]RST78731.1 hypothetical protein EJC49_25360 [Aquibium carbonis]